MPVYILVVTIFLPLLFILHLYMLQINNQLHNMPAFPYNELATYW